MIKVLVHVEGNVITVLTCEKQLSVVIREFANVKEEYRIDTIGRP